MTQAERDLMRQKLKGFISTHEYHPSYWLGAWSFVSSHAVASIAIAAFLLAGGTSALAHNAIPGDMLYPIKSQFNDRIRAAVIITDDGKIDFEIKQIGRSLDHEDRVMDSLLMEIGEDEDGGNGNNGRHRIETPEPDKDNNLEDEEREFNRLEQDLREEEDVQIEF